MFSKYFKYLVVCIIMCLSLTSCVKEQDVSPCCGDQIQIPDEPTKTVTRKSN